ncbi:MAG: hypothetical protein ACREHF_02100 [Rhizomicrobium sp.]
MTRAGGAADGLSPKELEHLALFLMRHERMKTSLEAIRGECDRGRFGRWRARIADLASLGLRKNP